MKKLLSKAGVVLGGMIFLVIWIQFIRGIIPYLVTYHPYLGYRETAIGAFILGCVLTPLWEELIFRHVPMQITKRINEYTKQDYTWYAILISSFIFGAGHNNGWYGILIQGFLGVMLCLVYLKNNYSYWSVVIIHAFWNIFVDYIEPYVRNLVDSKI